MSLLPPAAIRSPASAPHFASSLSLFCLRSFPLPLRCLRWCLGFRSVLAGSRLALEIGTWFSRLIQSGIMWGWKITRARDHFFSVQRRVMRVTVGTDLEIVMQQVALAELAAARIEDPCRQFQDLAA